MKTTSSVKTINAPIERVYATLSDLENLHRVVEKIVSDEDACSKIRETGHEDLIEKMRHSAFSRDRMEMDASGFGKITLEIVEREEDKCVKYNAAMSPVKGTIWIQLLPQGGTQTAMKMTVDADIPFFLRPMVGSKMKDAVEKTAAMIAQIQY